MPTYENPNSSLAQNRLQDLPETEPQEVGKSECNYNKLNYNNINNDLEDRVSKLERQIKTLDTRIQKLESVSNEINDNIYMI